MAAMLDRHEAAAVLQQQRVIFESAGEGIVFLKPKPEYVVSCNRRFTELFGYSQAEMIRMPLALASGPDSVESPGGGLAANTHRRPPLP